MGLERRARYRSLQVSLALELSQVLEPVSQVLTLTFACGFTLALTKDVSSCSRSFAVSTHLIDAQPLVSDMESENLSPQLEIAIASLVTLTCWRGIAARVRM